MSTESVFVPYGFSDGIYWLRGERRSETHVGSEIRRESQTRRSACVSLSSALSLSGPPFPPV